MNLAAAATPFRTQIAGLGAFPNSRNPKVIWVGMPGDQGNLLQFQEQLEDALAHVGFAKEKRSFSPHLTLGRVKEGKGKRELEQLIETYQSKDLGNFAADTIDFFQERSASNRPGLFCFENYQAVNSYQPSANSLKSYGALLAER